MKKLIPPESDYQRAFHMERQQTYPMVDALEARLGHAVDRPRLEDAARVLACPVKVHPPNWQHGRVLYALTRAYLTRQDPYAQVNCLDIGTAKGFSALCVQWALDDHGGYGTVTSLDVIDPASATRRNTVAECDGLKTLMETLEPWPEALAIQFLHETGIDYLTRNPGRIHVAYVDGKHDYHVVNTEGRLIAARQDAGDLAVFDDVHIPDVAHAVSDLSDFYVFERVEVLSHRAYAIGNETLMGILAEPASWVYKLHLPKGFSVCELGDQSITHTDPHQLAAGWYKSLGCKRYTSIDGNGRGTFTHDLNLPLPKKFKTFDLVTDFGTGEHIFDQAQVWRTIHQLVRPGGHIVFDRPLQGYPAHCYYRTDECLFRDIAAANHYEVIRLETREMSRGLLVRGMFRRPMSALPFVVPQQGRYHRMLVIPC